MAAYIEEVSKITAKGQTTVPKAVRQALGVGCGGRVAFRIDGDSVILRRVEDEDADPVIERFLAFLAQDAQERPEAMASIGSDLAARLTELTAGVEVDLDAPIEGEVAL